MKSLLSMREAADVLGVSLSTARRMMRSASATYDQLLVVEFARGTRRRHVLVRATVLRKILEGRPEPREMDL